MRIVDDKTKRILRAVQDMNKSKSSLSNIGDEQLSGTNYYVIKIVAWLMYVVSMIFTVLFTLTFAHSPVTMVAYGLFGVLLDSVKMISIVKGFTGISVLPPAENKMFKKGAFSLGIVILIISVVASSGSILESEKQNAQASFKESYEFQELEGVKGFQKTQIDTLTAQIEADRAELKRVRDALEVKEASLRAEVSKTFDDRINNLPSNYFDRKDELTREKNDALQQLTSENGAITLAQKSSQSEIDRLSSSIASATATLNETSSEWQTPIDTVAFNDGQQKGYYALYQIVADVVNVPLKFMDLEEYTITANTVALLAPQFISYVFELAAVFMFIVSYFIGIERKRMKERLESGEDVLDGELGRVMKLLEVIGDSSGNSSIDRNSSSHSPITLDKTMDGDSDFNEELEGGDENMDNDNSENSIEYDESRVDNFKQYKNLPYSSEKFEEFVRELELNKNTKAIIDKNQIRKALLLIASRASNTFDNEDKDKEFIRLDVNVRTLLEDSSNNLNMTRRLSTLIISSLKNLGYLKLFNEPTGRKLHLLDTYYSLIDTSKQYL